MGIGLIFLEHLKQMQAKAVLPELANLFFKANILCWLIFH